MDNRIDLTTEDDGKIDFWQTEEWKQKTRQTINRDDRAHKREIRFFPEQISKAYKKKRKKKTKAKKEPKYKIEEVIPPLLKPQPTELVLSSDDEFLEQELAHNKPKPTICRRPKPSISRDSHVSSRKRKQDPMEVAECQSIYNRNQKRRKLDLTETEIVKIAQEANQLIHSGREQEALDVLQSYIDRYGDNMADVHFFWGVIWEEMGDPQKAENHYRESLKNSSNMGESNSNLARLLYNCGKYKKAEKICAKAMQHNPEIVDLAVTRLMCLFHLDKFKVGNQLARKMFKKFPNDADVTYWAGMVDKNPQSALGFFQISNKLMPHRSETLSQMGNRQSALRLEYAKKAVRSFDRAFGVEFHGDKYAEGDARINYAASLEDVGRYEDAKAEYGRIISRGLDEHVMDACNNLGCLLERENKFGSALGYYDKALSVAAKHNQKHDDAQKGAKRMREILSQIEDGTHRNAQGERKYIPPRGIECKAEDETTKSFIRFLFKKNPRWKEVTQVILENQIAFDDLRDFDDGDYIQLGLEGLRRRSFCKRMQEFENTRLNSRKALFGKIYMKYHDGTDPDDTKLKMAKRCTKSIEEAEASIERQMTHLKYLAKDGPEPLNVESERILGYRFSTQAIKVLGKIGHKGKKNIEIKPPREDFPQFDHEQIKNPLKQDAMEFLDIFIEEKHRDNNERKNFETYIGPSVHVKDKNQVGLFAKEYIPAWKLLGIFQPKCIYSITEKPRLEKRNQYTMSVEWRPNKGPDIEVLFDPLRKSASYNDYRSGEAIYEPKPPSYQSNSKQNLTWVYAYYKGMTFILEVTCKDIQKDEEILVYYGDNYFHE